MANINNMQENASLVLSPESNVLYYKIEGNEGVTFKRTQEIVNQAILSKWKAEIKNTDNRGRALFLEFPFKIRKSTIEAQLAKHGFQNLVKVFATKSFTTNRDMKKLMAAKRKLDQDSRTNVTTHYHVTLRNEEALTYQELLDVLNNTIMKKWFAKISLEDIEAKEVFLTFPVGVDQATVSKYLKKEKLSGVLKVEHIGQVPDLESHKRFKAIQKRIQGNDSQLIPHSCEGNNTQLVPHSCHFDSYYS